MGEVAKQLEVRSDHYNKTMYVIFRRNDVMNIEAIWDIGYDKEHMELYSSFFYKLGFKIMKFSYLGSNSLTSAS